MQTCRFCGEWRGDMVKYGVRHYAHFGCFLENKGANGYLSLHDWQMVSFPWKLLQQHSLTSDACAANERIVEGREK